VSLYILWTFLVDTPSTVLHQVPIHLYKRFYNAEKYFEENEIDRDLFHAVSSSPMFNFYEILRGHFTKFEFF
jgi:hypothetical protein